MNHLSVFIEFWTVNNFEVNKSFFNYFLFPWQLFVKSTRASCWSPSEFAIIFETKFTMPLVCPWQPCPCRRGAPLSRPCPPNSIQSAPSPCFDLNLEIIVKKRYWLEIQHQTRERSPVTGLGTGIVTHDLIWRCLWATVTNDRFIKIDVLTPSFSMTGVGTEPCSGFWIRIN